MINLEKSELVSKKKVYLAGYLGIWSPFKISFIVFYLMNQLNFIKDQVIRHCNFWINETPDRSSLTFLIEDINYLQELISS